MYCDFNPKLFKRFVSKSKKIVPALADDWEIIPDQFRKIDGFSLRSRKLNQEVADINLRMFLRFCKEQNLTINGLKLDGIFIIGNDRKIYTEEMYNEWNNKYNKRTETIINKKDYIPGNIYKTPCGAKIVYLGYRYVTQLKNDKDFSKHSKITKKYYYCSIDFGDNLYDRINELRMKLSEDKGPSKFSSEDCEKILHMHYVRNKSITCFEKEKPKNIEYHVVEDNEFDISDGTLLVSLNGEEGFYTTKGFRYYNNSFSKFAYKLNSDFTMECIHMNIKCSDRNNERPYRIYIKKDTM